MILVWYQITCGYKLYDSSKKMIVSSKDVVFDKIKELQ